MTPVGFEPATFRFVAQHLNHCATAVPSNVLDPTGNEETSDQHIFGACKPIDNRLGTFERCDSPWSDVPMGALIQVENILNIFLWTVTW